MHAVPWQRCLAFHSCCQQPFEPASAVVQILNDFEDGEDLPTLLTPTLVENVSVTVLTGDAQPQDVLGGFALDTKFSSFSSL